MTKQMILREFQSYTKYRKGKEYQCNVCRKKINECETYFRHGKNYRNRDKAITLHPECYEKQLKKELLQMVYRQGLLVMNLKSLLFEL